MFGHKMLAPRDGSAAAARESALLAAESIAPAAFATLGKLAEGTRRPLMVPVGDAEAHAGDDGALVVSVTLPPGSYATVLLGELMK
jgi:tRNA(Glu) U13 pseudouridine synthase TruD